MAKDPAFLFYPGDWMGGTMVFSRHQKGAYIDLLMGQFHNGHMGLHMVETILGEKDFTELWENILKPKFKVDNEGKYYNEKLDYEINRRKKFTQSRLENLSHMKDHTGSHMENHMENGNGNINSIDTKKNKSGKSKDFKVQREESFFERVERNIEKANRSRKENNQG